MDKNNDNSLEIECPHCFKENKINLSTEIKCKHCDKPLIGEKYRKPIISGMTAIIFGLSGGYYVNEWIDKERYPISVEYSIIEKCVSNYDKPIKKKIYGNKREVCICAMEKTEQELSYSEMKETTHDFINIFESKARGCM